MHTAAVTRSAQSLGIAIDRTALPWRSRLRAILGGAWERKNDEAKNGGVYRHDDRLPADLGLYREHRIHQPQNRTDQQLGSPVPVALLAIWMPGV